MADKESKQQEIVKKDVKQIKKRKRSYMITIRLITAVMLALLVLVGILKLALLYVAMIGSGI